MVRSGTTYTPGPIMEKPLHLTASGWSGGKPAVAVRAQEKPSHVVLWHKLIDAAIPAAITAAVRLCIAVNLCQSGAARRRSDAKRDVTCSYRADNCYETHAQLSTGPTSAIRMRRHLATQKQGDWTAVAARDYASHRQTFQAAYARDCWRRLSQRPAVAPVVARAARVLDVGCGSGEFTRELAELLAHRTIVGLDVSNDMVRHARVNAHERVSYAVANLANDVGLRELSGCNVDDGAALAGPGPCVLGRRLEPA